MTVCLMLKVPRPGEVKTRLGKEVGMSLACTIYRKLVEHQMAQIPSWCQLEIHYAPVLEGELMKAWLGEDQVYIAQAEGDLGDRLGLATQNAFERKAKAVLLLGGDCPDVTAQVLEDAAARLESHDIVLGPATDGGYYLVAMKAYHPHLFSRIEWSTKMVLDQTLDRTREKGLSSFLLSPLADVDDYAGFCLAQKAHPFLR